jgi:hypothetical protein
VRERLQGVREQEHSCAAHEFSHAGRDMSAKKSRRATPAPAIPAPAAAPAVVGASAAAAASAAASTTAAPPPAWIDSPDPRRRLFAKIFLVAVWIYVAALWLLALDQWFNWGIFGPKVPPVP